MKKLREFLPIPTADSRPSAHETLTVKKHHRAPVVLGCSRNAALVVHKHTDDVIAAGVPARPGLALPADGAFVRLLEHSSRLTHWRRSLHQIAVHIQAAKLDPFTDRRLLSRERTGISELDNALFALQGPKRSVQDTAALADNPHKVPCADGRAVGLGQYTASVWLQLRRGSHGLGHIKDLTRAERHSARARFILALAHCIAPTGDRACDASLSMRLAEWHR